MIRVHNCVHLHFIVANDLVKNRSSINTVCSVFKHDVYSSRESWYGGIH